MPFDVQNESGPNFTTRCGPQKCMENNFCFIRFIFFLIRYEIYSYTETLNLWDLAAFSFPLHIQTEGHCTMRRTPTITHKRQCRLIKQQKEENQPLAMN